MQPSALTSSADVWVSRRIDGLVIETEVDNGQRRYAVVRGGVEVASIACAPGWSATFRPRQREEWWPAPRFMQESRRQLFERRTVDPELTVNGEPWDYRPSTVPPDRATIHTTRTSWEITRTKLLRFRMERLDRPGGVVFGPNLGIQILHDDAATVALATSLLLLQFEVGFSATMRGRLYAALRRSGGGLWPVTGMRR